MTNVIHAWKKLIRNIFRISSTRFLLLSNVFGAAVSFCVVLYAARILGPEQFGVAAVISGIATFFLAFLDIRFNDIASKAFFQSEGISPDNVPAYQAGILWLGVGGTAVLSCGTAILASVTGHFFIPFFTEVPVETWWLTAVVAGVAINTTAGTMMFLMRLSKRFYLLGISRIILSPAMGSVTVIVITLRPDISGYFLALLGSGFVNLTLTFSLFVYLWKWRVGLPLFSPHHKAAFSVFRKSFPMFFYTNLLGYGKLLQRSTDLLFVAYFTDDRETGIYKLARQCVDNGLAVVQEAFYQVYYPTFLDAFARKAREEYRALAIHLRGRAALMTAVLMAGELMFLPVLGPLVFSKSYSGIEWPIIVLSSTMIFHVGFHPWIWAITVGSGKMRYYTSVVYLAVVFQYAVTIVLFFSVGASALTAMIGAVSYYFLFIPATYRHIRRRFPGYAPGIGEVG